MKAVSSLMGIDLIRPLLSINKVGLGLRAAIPRSIACVRICERADSFDSINRID